MPRKLKTETYQVKRRSGLLRRPYYEQSVQTRPVKRGCGGWLVLMIVAVVVIVILAGVLG